MKRIKIPKNNSPKFIIVNESMQVFSGLKSGYPNFEPDWNMAKPLENIKQFEAVKRGTLDKLEMLYL